MSDHTPDAPPDLRDRHGRLWRWNPHQNCYQHDNDLETWLRCRSTLEADSGPLIEVQR